MILPAGFGFGLITFVRFMDVEAQNKSYKEVWRWRVWGSWRTSTSKRVGHVDVRP